MEVLRRRDWRAQAWTNFLGTAARPTNREEWLLWARLQTLGKRQIIADYDRYMEAVSQQAQAPYGARQPVASPDDPVVQSAAGMAEYFGFVPASEETFERLLLMTLALRAYRLERGGYPGALSELTPEYVKRSPDDPFALKVSFQYRRQGARYLLYSVGPDGKDDGGRPIPHRPIVDVSSGDIVAGVNKY